MTDHLPECPQLTEKPDWYCCEDCDPGVWDDCICDRLRACEQRVRMEDDDYAYVAAQAEADGRRRGWADALDAARRAVDSALDAPPQHNVRVVAQIALAAIDALREEKPPPLPPSVGVPTTPMWPAQ